METHYLPVTWDTYHALTQSLAEQILTNGYHIDEIVAISRGGLTLGHLLTDFLKVPISTFTIQSYTDIQTQGEVKITIPLQSQIAGKQILLVDDVSDSGTTLKRATEYLKEFNPTVVHTATLFYKPHSVFKPDYFGKETSYWILFPYEPTEMIGLITKAQKELGKTEEEIRRFLLSLSYTGEQIDFAAKHYRL